VRAEGPERQSEEAEEPPRPRRERGGEARAEPGRQGLADELPSGNGKKDGEAAVKARKAVPKAIPAPRS
jgi:hypothetical protein